LAIPQGLVRWIVAVPDRDREPMLLNDPSKVKRVLGTEVVRVLGLPLPKADEYDARLARSVDVPAPTPELARVLRDVLRPERVVQRLSEAVVPTAV